MSVNIRSFLAEGSAKKGKKKRFLSHYFGRAASSYKPFNLASVRTLFENWNILKEQHVNPRDQSYWHLLTTEKPELFRTDLVEKLKNERERRSAEKKVLKKLGLTKWPETLNGKDPISVLDKIKIVEAKTVDPNSLPISIWTLGAELFNKSVSNHITLLEVRKLLHSKGLVEGHFPSTVGKMVSVEAYRARIRLLEESNIPILKFHFRIPFSRLKQITDSVRKGKTSREEKIEFLKGHNLSFPDRILAQSLKKLKHNVSLFLDAGLPIHVSRLTHSKTSLERCVARLAKRKKDRERRQTELASFMKEREIPVDSIPKYIIDRRDEDSIIKKIKEIERTIGRRFKDEWWWVNSSTSEFDKQIKRHFKMQDVRAQRRKYLGMLNSMCDEREIAHRPHYIFGGGRIRRRPRFSYRTTVSTINRLEKETELKFSGQWWFLNQYYYLPERMIELYPSVHARCEEIQRKRIGKLRSFGLTEEQSKEYSRTTMVRIGEVEESFASAGLNPAKYMDEFLNQLGRKEDAAIDRLHEDRIRGIIGDKLSALKQVNAETVYENQIQAHPLLSHEETMRLFEELKNGNPKVKEVLVLANLRLVAKVAHKAMMSGAGLRAQALDFFDLMQEGNGKLLSIIETFDHSKGIRFSTYAYISLEHHFRRVLDVDSNVPASYALYKKKIDKFVKRFSSRFGREPSISEMADELNKGLTDKILTEADISTILQGVHMTSLDQPVDEDEETPLMDIISSGQDVKDNAEAVSRIDSEHFRELVKRGLKSQPMRNRKMMLMKWGLNDGAPRTLEEVGRRFRMTRERVRQIEMKCLKILKTSEGLRGMMES